VARYSRAPIVEAVIDIKVKQRVGFSLDLFDALAASETSYPDRKVMRLGTGTVDLDKNVPVTGNVKVIGTQFWTADKSRAFQATEYGFSSSRLAPYDCWDDFRDEARRLWKRYREVTQPEAITRAAVRFINRLDLPEPADLDRYLRTKPVIASDLPQALEGWFMQLQIPDGEYGLILSEGAVPSPTSPATVGVLLDIDVFTMKVPQEEGELWELFERLRVRKNVFFEGSITEELRGRIE
jgi:uncharacterized protein (TIGR04255 family)